MIARFAPNLRRLSTVAAATVLSTAGLTAGSAHAAPATPTITTVASSGGPVGTAIYDTASLDGIISPSAGATLTFFLFNANPANANNVAPCASAAGMAWTSGPINVSNGGTYTSPSVVPPAGGYYWAVYYSGDPTNTNANSPTPSVGSGTTCIVQTELVEITGQNGTVQPAATGSPDEQGKPHEFEHKHDDGREHQHDDGDHFSRPDDGGDHFG